MSGLAPITEAEVKEFAKDWYHKLDIHVPLEEFVPMLAEQGLEMVFLRQQYTALRDSKVGMSVIGISLMKFTP